MPMLKLDEVALRNLAHIVAERLKPTVRRASIAAASDGVMMTLSEVCAYIKMSRTKFYYLRRGEVRVDGQPLPPFPAPRHNGSCAVWQRRDVDQWLERLPPHSGMVEGE